ncbi:hypothetical protein DFH09DRAFT_1324335 [Mycena vulgaris]|nr:hypothetical protein DFH09DRAFT_1324335 [Mycena vulgaris]
MPVSLLSASLATAVLQNLLYGGYVLLSLLALYLNLTRRRRQQLNNPPAVPRWRVLSPVVLGALFLFVAITCHWILNVVRLSLAFQEDGAGPRIFYAEASHWTELAKYGFLVVSLVIGDWFLVHRLWVVWAFRTRIIIFPAISLMGLLAFGVGLLYQLSKYRPDDNIFQGAFRRWTTGVCSFCFCTAMYTTGLIWYKLWTKSRMLKSLGVTGLSTIIRIFMDSAALLTGWSTFHIISYQCGSNLQFIAADCIPAIIGISNLLVQIRLYWDLTGERESSGSADSAHRLRFATDSEITQSDLDQEPEKKCTLPPLDVAGCPAPPSVTI